MGCTIEFNESSIRFDFSNNKQKQKIFVDVLLRYSKLDLPGLAAVLNVSIDTLHDVHRGVRFLEGEAAENLARLFLIFVSE